MDPIPVVGSVIHYVSKVSGAELAAIVTGTQTSLLPEGIASGGVPPVSSDEHVHLHVLTPGRPGHGRERAEAMGVDTSHNQAGYYQEWDVPHDEGKAGGTWHWPGHWPTTAMPLGGRAVPVDPAKGWPEP